MVRTLIRQTLAVVVAVAVVLSFVGAPVAAATALDTESDSGLGSLDGDSTSSDDTADDSDGSGDDGSTDDENTDDEQTDDGTDTSDGSTNGDTSDGDASGDGSADEDDSSSDDRSLGSDDDTTNDDAANENDSSGDGSLGSDDGDDSSANESDERRTDRMEDAVNGTTDAGEDSTVGLEASTDSLEADGGVVETADGLLDSVSDAAIGLTTIGFDNPFDGDDVSGVDRTYDDAARDHHDEPAADDGTGADDDEADDNDAAAAAGTDDGDRPDPADPAGAGAAIGLGAVATAAALRGSPIVAGSKTASSGGVLSTLLDKVRPFVFPLRYSRYDDSDPLEHEARERVYEIVNETPGSYLSEVSQEADLPLSTTRHHIKVLEREDLVTGAKLHGKRRFYPAYAEGIELAAALNDESTAKIIAAIGRIGAASVSDLADELGRDPSTISHHLQRLEDDGVITRERDGRAVVNRLSAEARTALEPEATAAGDAGEVVAGGAD